LLHENGRPERRPGVRAKTLPSQPLPAPPAATLVADSALPELRGTSFGMFNLVTDAALLAASVIAGVLWDAFGAQWTFLAGAVFALLTIGGLIPLHGKLAHREREVSPSSSASPRPLPSCRASAVVESPSSPDYSPG
jgi:MFS family permease